MSDLNYEFETEMWLYSGKAAWHFVTVPKEFSEHIKAFVQSKTPGFGSIRVKASVNGHEWQTSIFPDTKSGCYQLPIKAIIRKKAKVLSGERVKIRLDIDV